MSNNPIENPFRPGAGHQPPYLAGRVDEQNEFKRLLGQKVITENLILTGLRGMGKTVLLDTFKPIAQSCNWLWTGADFSESTSSSEEAFALRIVTDLSQITSACTVTDSEKLNLGFLGKKEKIYTRANYNFLIYLYNHTPGLISDKLKAVLEFSWNMIKTGYPDANGLIFAYDEAQNLEDRTQQNQYPLSNMLDVFQSIQKKSIPFMLVLTGLPTLFPKLVDARTYAERMFHSVILGPLSEDASREAITKPIQDAGCSIGFDESGIRRVIKFSCGYPYFIQYMCKEIFDAWISNILSKKSPSVLFDDIVRKLDMDFFQGRWANVTDRQKEFLKVVANLDNCDQEFSAKDIVSFSKKYLKKPFSSSHTNQILNTLIQSGIIFRNGFGRYSFAVPLLAQFIKRQKI